MYVHTSIRPEIEPKITINFHWSVIKRRPLRILDYFYKSCSYKLSDYIQYIFHRTDLTPLEQMFCKYERANGISPNIPFTFTTPSNRFVEEIKSERTGPVELNPFERHRAGQNVNSNSIQFN